MFANISNFIKLYGQAKTCMCLCFTVLHSCTQMATLCIKGLISKHTLTDLQLSMEHSALKY